VRRIWRGTLLVSLAASLIFCCAAVAQNEKGDQKPDTAALVDAPVVPQMVVDSDGTLHFGSRTVPLPALASPEARQAYTLRMLQRAQSSAGRGGGLASVRTTETIAPAERVGARRLPSRSIRWWRRARKSAELALRFIRPRRSRKKIATRWRWSSKWMPRQSPSPALANLK